MAIIEVNHVTKEYQLGQLRSIKQAALDAITRIRGKTVPELAPFKALDDVDFKVEPGEVVGIIGQNGAGKSTLLKILAGISKPTSGIVAVRGKVAPLIEVGAGLVPDLSGRENIYLNGAILGLKRTDISAKFDEIVAFAELEQFIDTPTKRYSSGMRVRLGFSIATSVDADILIVDEVLAVGDIAFQRKCFDRMEDLIKRKGRAVLIVSHNIRQVERICTRAILLEHGRIAEEGRPTEVCNRFYEQSDQRIRQQSGTISTGRSSRGANSGEVEFVSVTIRDAEGKTATTVEHRSDITIAIVYRVHAELVNVIFGVGVHTTDLLYLADKDTEDDNFVQRKLSPGTYVLQCRIRSFPLLPGVYSLRLGVAVGEIYRIAFYAEGVHPFHVTGKHKTRPHGFVALDTSWDLVAASTSDTPARSLGQGSATDHAVDHVAGK